MTLNSRSGIEHHNRISNSRITVNCRNSVCDTRCIFQHIRTAELFSGWNYLQSKVTQGNQPCQR